jgi:hypothetical protein
MALILRARMLAWPSRLSQAGGRLVQELRMASRLARVSHRKWLMPLVYEGKGDSQGKVFASIGGLPAPRQKFSDDFAQGGVRPVENETSGCGPPG